ncbi:MAG: HlyC/CorC family transporter [Chloroflexi bacterium]|nr:HlyC/CorC family transporter [Chloroflexota bacterium]
MGTAGDLLIIVILVLLNAVFVAAEIALVTIRRSRLEQLVDEGHHGAERVRRLVAHPGRFLAVIQLGITFVGFLAAAFAGVSLTVQLEDWFRTIPPLAPYAGAVALLIVTALLSFFTIIFGELVPKTLALAYTERIALLLAGPVDLLGRILGPIVWALTKITSGVNRILGVRDIDPDVISTEELKLLVERGGEQGVLEAEEEQMINAVIELGDRRVHEVMVPRVSIVGIRADETFEAAIDIIIAEGHSRIPAYEESLDEVVGILYAKDLLPYLKSDAEGIVTIEDLLEEIVGEIQDEYDVEEPMVVRLSEDEARIDGRADVDELRELFDVHLDLEDEEEYDTIGGLLYHRIGGVPTPGDTIEVDRLTLTVETTDGRRVGKVLVVRHPRRDDEVEDDR